MSAPERPAGARARTNFAAAHIAMLPSYAGLELAPDAAGRAAQIAAHLDWPATAELRRQLDALGFGIAEAMDTAQRFELGWPLAARLIESCGRLELTNGFVAGAGCDQLDAIGDRQELVTAVVEQARFVRAHGGLPVILPMAWLTETRADARTYVEVYEAIADGLDGPAIVHWLGEMFLPSLAGYFPGDSFRELMARCPERYVGAKLSLLDREREVALRRELRERGQVIFTGDDWNFAELMLGGSPEQRGRSVAPIEAWSSLAGRPLAQGDFSHALLGVFGAIARPVQRALACLEAGDAAGYRREMQGCEELGRWLFQPPVPHYKAGIAFLSYLDGRQPHFLLPLHAERARSDVFLIEAARLGREARVFADEALSARRLEAFRAR